MRAVLTGHLMIGYLLGVAAVLIGCLVADPVGFLQFLEIVP